MESEVIFEQRKVDHIEHCLNDSVDVSADSFAKVKLIHEALPEVDFNQIDISKNILGYIFSSPIFISSMTAGHSMGQKINYTLAAVCAQKNWLFNVGSQRKQLKIYDSTSEWQEIKQNFPNVRMCANLGLAQIITSDMLDIEKIISSIDAIGLIIHLNPLQEALQMEGTPQFKGGLEKIKEICQGLSVPVILKETGCGFSANTLNKVKGTGVKVVDLAGFGGTHWGRVEGLRAQSNDNMLLCNASETFKDWAAVGYSQLRPSN